jgi:hypothetical protein
MACVLTQERDEVGSASAALIPTHDVGRAVAAGQNTIVQVGHVELNPESYPPFAVRVTPFSAAVRAGRTPQA